MPHAVVAEKPLYGTYQQGKRKKQKTLNTPKAFPHIGDKEYECEVNGGAAQAEHQARTIWLP